jgi:hypothetical protein
VARVGWDRKSRFAEETNASPIRRRSRRIHYRTQDGFVLRRARDDDRRRSRPCFLPKGPELGPIERSSLRVGVSIRILDRKQLRVCVFFRGRHCDESKQVDAGQRIASIEMLLTLQRRFPRE